MTIRLSIFALIFSIGLHSVHGQVNLTPSQLFPPGDTAWTLETIGLNGTLAFKLLVEQSGSAAANSFYFDGTANGFPGGVGTGTDDIVVFSGSDIPGKISTLAVPAGAYLSLFHDITDVTGVPLSGPNGVLDTEDAYLNSNPIHNYTRVGADQLIKYYGANESLSYQFTAFGQTVQLGSGFIAFIFIEEDHTPNYDYNDMIIGILPTCVNDADCDDHRYCNGIELCAFGAAAITGGVCMGGTAPVCDDGVACTFNECREQPGGHSCLYKPHDQDCDDDNFCNGEEICDSQLGCRPGKQVDCSDGVDCTVDVCLDKGKCVHTPDNSICSDDNACNGAEVCHRTKGCQSGPAPVCGDGLFCNGLEFCDPATGCKAGASVDCSSLNGACVVGVCNEQADACVIQPVGDGTLCNDGLFCNVGETCVAGQCAGGGPLDCSDGVSCTNDSCNEAIDQCVRTPDNELCIDELFCNGQEACNPSKGCMPGTPPNCADLVACTVDSCDEANDQCLHLPDSVVCDDALFCNGVEICDPVLDCRAGPPVICNDHVPCTIDSCDETLNQCAYASDSGACDNFQFCDGAEFCDPATGCHDGPDPECDDGIDCTIDLCNPQLNACEYIPDDSECMNELYCDGEEVCDPVLGCVMGIPVGCDDGNPCTTDSCDEFLDDCVHDPLDSVCDDGLFCNGSETCGPRGCEPGFPPCPPGLVCDEEVGCVTCLTEGDCPDGTFCQGTPSCIANVCVYDPPSCDDGIPCTLDRCDPKTDACVHTPDDSLCNNGNFCDGLETCHPTQGCLPGTPVNCNDEIACTIDQCVEAKDICIHTPNNTACLDGLFCNGTEICHPTQGCLPGTPVGCVDGSNCSVDSCNEVTDQCDHLCDVPEITCTDQSFECDDVGEFIPPVVDDDCSKNPVATCTEVITPSKLPQERTVTRTCSFTNDCGNSATCQQVIDIEDTTPPEVQCPPDRRFECDGVGDAGEPIVSDNCDPDPQVTVVVEEIPGDCTPNTAGISPPPKLIKLTTYSVTDGASTVATGDTTGNITTCTQRIEIIDTRSPLVVSCPASVPGCAGMPLVFTPPACNDTCGTCSVICTRSDGLPLNDPVPFVGALTVRCVARDECENASAPCDVIVDTEQCDNTIPTVSQWGLIILALLLLIGAKLRFARERGALIHEMS